MRRRTRHVTVVLTGLALVLATAPLAAGEPPAHAQTAYGAYLARFGAPATSSTVAGPDSPTSFDATLPNGRRVTPAGVSVQVGQNPLNSVLTPDGKYLITTNDDERNNTSIARSVVPGDLKNGSDVSRGKYTIAVTRTEDMTLVASVAVPARKPAANPGSVFNNKTNREGGAALFLGLVTVPAASGSGYTLYASGGVADVIYRYAMGADGKLVGSPLHIAVPVPQDKTQTTYGMAVPGWLTLSADAHTLYVVNNNGNSVTPFDIQPAVPVAGTPVPVGYFPYAAQVYNDKLFVSNWGVTDRTFADGEGTKDPVTGNQVHTGTPFIGAGSSNLFADPVTDPEKSSSLSVLSLDNGTPQTDGSLSLARPIDGVNVVGGTHPSALAVAKGSDGSRSALYVTDTNEDRIAVVDPDTEQLVRKIALPAPAALAFGGEPPLAHQAGRTFGLQPNALAVSPDQRRLYVAEAGLNSVAVYDIAEPQQPTFLGRIPTGWYPTGVTVSPDGQSLYITNSKGAGSPYSFQGAFGTTLDSNWMFGSAQKVDLNTIDLKQTTQSVEDNTVVHKNPDQHLLKTLQKNIEHVVFILRENKTYDTYLGDDAILNARGANGGGSAFAKYAADVPNTRKIAEQYAVGDNVYADAEESNAGHSFALAGTSTDYMQKTMLERSTRPLTNIKNQDPEDYPLQGYLFNAMARGERTFRDYGDSIRISGYDDGPPAPASFCADDPKPGCTDATYNSILDTTSPTTGLGGQYSVVLPALKVLKGNLDEQYPGWNLRISDQRRASEFISDFGALVDKGQAPEFTYLWLPVDHTGGCTSAGFLSCGPDDQVKDNDRAVGRVLEYLTHSAIWPHTVVFMTEDDGQSSPDHVSPHRTYTSVISPYVKHATVMHSQSSTVSIPKTIEEILNLPAMGYGDLLANDLLDWFTDVPDYTPYVAVDASAYPVAPPVPAVAQRIWDLSAQLTDDDFDSGTGELGQLSQLYEQSVQLAKHDDGSAGYRQQQDDLYARAREIVADE